MKTEARRALCCWAIAFHVYQNCVNVAGMSVPKKITIFLTKQSRQFYTLMNPVPVARQMKLLAVPGHTTYIDIPDADGMTLVHHAQMGTNWLLVFENDKRDPLLIMVDMKKRSYCIVESDMSDKPIPMSLTAQDKLPESKL